MPKKIKICCISSLAEAQLAIKMGASAIGLVGNMPSGPGIISNELSITIAKSIPEGVDIFILTSETDVYKIIEHQKNTEANTIQLVDSHKSETYKILRQELPNVKLVQVIHVMNQETLKEALAISNSVDAILLDSGNPNLQIKELGGTGRTHNWDISSKIVKSLKIPVYLAGGLNPDNIIEAIERVKPYGVDICSGVRTNGLLDPLKLQRFINAVNDN